jgi:autotransporter-associated beta strand protein
MFSKNSTTTGILNLNGGTLSTTKLTMNLAGTSIANFNGGVLKALGNTTTFINNLSNAVVYSGGITLDDGGFNVTVPQVLTAPAGNGISATGLSVSGTGFIGEPVVEISGGGGTGATAIANIDGSGNLTGVTITNPGTGYTSSPSFTILGGGVGSSGSISGSAALVPNVGGGLIKQGTGNVTLSAANTYSGGTTVNAGTLILSGSVVSPTIGVANGATLTVASAGTIPSTVAVTNNGIVNLNGAARTIGSLSGAATTAAVNLNTTNLTVSGGGTYAGSIADSGTNGALTVGAALSVGSVKVGTINANANLQIHGTSKASALNLTGGTGAWTSGLDLTASKFILESTVSGKTADLARVQEQVNYGKTHADGIFTTSTLDPHYAIAVIDNGVTNLGTFGGVSADANSVLVGAELLGDANIDGTVNLADLTAVLNNFGATTSAWTSGNFDGAATIDLTDLAYVLNNMNMTNPNASVDFGSTGTTVSATGTPEPASLAVLATGALALISRRRRVPMSSK